MANQQPPYHNSGYYNPYLYHNGYAQQYAQPPPHYGPNGHPPPHTPPRTAGGPSNGAGRGSYANRGHQPYHPHLPIYNQHFQHVDGATPSPPPISSTYTHSHPQKSQPAHTSYPHYPIHPANPYLSWPTEPLSPLPKQLSGLNHFPPHATATPQPAPPTHDALRISEPALQPAPEPVLEPTRRVTPEPVTGVLIEPVPEPVAEPATEHVSEPVPVPELVPPPPDVPPAPSPEESSPIITSPPAVKQPATLPVEKSKQELAIWSRRPTDPSTAPAIIISPRARPPPRVVDDALDLPTPPLTPIQTAVSIPEDQDKGPEVIDEPPTVQTQTPNSSSPITETTAATPSVHDITTPASPISSHTSMSNASSSEVKSPSTPSTAVPAEIPPAVEPPRDEATEAEDKPPAPPIPAVPAVKKSWASLLKNDDTISTGKNALPTSTIVGFSVPGGVIENTSTTPIPPTRKQELVALLTTGPSGSGQVPKIRPRGLVNGGNMCFANAVLQVLVYCPPFNRLFTELAKYLPGPLSSDNKKSVDSRISLTTGTIEFLKEFNPITGKERKRREEEGEDMFLDSFTPVSVYDAMRAKKRFDNMRGGHQEDAEEFLGFYLDTLEDELLSLLASVSPKPNTQSPNHTQEREEVAPKEGGWMEVGRKNRTVVTRTAKATDSPITRIFGGTFRSTLRVPQHKDSVVVESWRALQLDIQREQVNSIREALQCISNPQPVTVTSPTRPGVSVDAHQQVLIESLPPILVLHLKRFLYDTSVGDVIKIGKPISFTAELEIDSSLITPGRRQSQKVKYKLFGVLYHHGLSASGGHYTLDVLHPNRDMTQKPREAWMRIDDELVSDVLPKDVFEADRDHRCPYLLFYKRIANPWMK